MILNDFKPWRRYERLAYLESQILSELEPLFFSISRFSSGTRDPDTLMYTALAVIGVTATVGVVGTISYYILRNDKKHPLDVTNQTLETTADFAGDAYNSAGNAVNAAGKVMNSATRTVRASVSDLNKRFKQ